MVELNQSCDCKSGLKYRECCLPLKGLSEFLPTTGLCHEFTIFAERYTLNVLLKKSKEFIAFYGSERSRIVTPIVWGVDPSLAANMRVCNISGLNIIILKRSPISLEDSFDAAHELSHLLCAEAGYPAITLTEKGNQDKRNANLCSAFANSINDPLANSCLIKYNFNLWDYYDRACRIQKGFFERGTFLPHPSDFRYKAFFIPFYIQKVLDWELACAVEPRDKHEFISWLEARYPILSKESLELISLIKSIGFDTPDKATTIFQKIIRQCGVRDILDVTSIR